MEQKQTKYLNRMFTKAQREKCWQYAKVIPGRDSERWRRDTVGNPVMKPLVGCMGPLCHEYDHIIPYSKGGKTSSKNCQILQTTVNRFKKDKIYSLEELEKASIKVELAERDMDLLEYALYGNIIKN